MPQERKLEWPNGKYSGYFLYSVSNLEFTLNRVSEGEREPSIASFTLAETRVTFNPELCALIMELDVKPSEIVFRERIYGADYSIYTPLTLGESHVL